MKLDSPPETWERNPMSPGVSTFETLDHDKDAMKVLTFLYLNKSGKVCTFITRTTEDKFPIMIGKVASKFPADLSEILNVTVS